MKATRNHKLPIVMVVCMALVLATVLAVAGVVASSAVTPLPEANLTVKAVTSEALLVPTLIEVGDANGDGDVDVGDIVAIERHLAGDAGTTTWADANLDNAVNQSDIDYLYRVVLGFEEVLHTVLGDANGDGAINVGDVISIEQQWLGVIPVRTVSDANWDGSVDCGDVIYVERVILGLSPQLSP